MPSWLNVLLTAAVSGGVAAIAQSQLDPEHPASLKVTGSLFGVGALVGVLNQLRAAPGTINIPADEPKSKSKSAGQ